MLDIVFNNSTGNKIYGKGFFKKVIEQALKTFDFKFKSSGKVELSVNLVGERKITELNKKYRGKNKPTDVLSFPLGEKIGMKRVFDGIIALGDIFICLPLAKRYAEKGDVGLDFKLAFLTVHGFLHLLGHEHERSAEKAKKMDILQSKILKDLNL